jgi:hypothetical protein
VNVKNRVILVLNRIDQLHKEHFLICLLSFSIFLALIWAFLEEFLAEGTQKENVGYVFIAILVVYAVWFSKYQDRDR